jgi:hypothetical protein
MATEIARIYDFFSSILNTASNRNAFVKLCQQSARGGQLGTAVVNQLLKKTSANQIAIFVRDESKASAFKKQGVDIRVYSRLKCEGLS